MARVSIAFGAILILLGVGCYAAAEPENRSFTALIPAIEGTLLMIFGVISLKPNMVKLGMHLAVLVGLIGFIASIISIIKRNPTGIAAVDMYGMALISGIFVALCVRSFIQARRARQTL